MNHQIETNLVMALRAIADLRELALKADADQYNAPVYGLRRGDHESRSGQPNDPTGDLASCPERLHLQRIIKLTEKDSAALKSAAILMKKRMERALKPYTDE